MQQARKSPLPQSLTEWNKVANPASSCTDVYALPARMVKSGSHQKRPQYNALRVLWRCRPALIRDFSVFGTLDWEQARRILDAYHPFHVFLAAIVPPKPPSLAMGVFASVLLNQRMACGWKMDPHPPLATAASGSSGNSQQDEEDDEGQGDDDADGADAG